MLFQGVGAEGPVPEEVMDKINELYELSDMAIDVPEEPWLYQDYRFYVEVIANWH